MKREIVSRRTYKDKSCSRRAIGTTIITLSCGHVKYYKFSQAPNTLPTVRSAITNMPDVQSEREKKIFELIGNQFDVDVDKITLKTTFDDDLTSDELDRVELAMDTEEEFDITIPDGPMDAVKTVGDYVKLVEKIINQEPA